MPPVYFCRQRYCWCDVITGEPVELFALNPAEAEGGSRETSERSGG